jgi:branched-chain amino acid aminotransferase
MWIASKETMKLLGVVGILSFSPLFVNSLSSTNLARTTKHADPTPGVDWDTFKFGLNGVRTGFMWMDRVPADHATDGSGSLYSSSADDCLQPLAPLELSPMSTVLNYAQCVFEGLKAFRRQDGSIGIFRPDRNALRMQHSADRFVLPPVPTSTFLEAADAVVRANANWVPPPGRGSMYLRPILMGTAEGLGALPSDEATFCVYGSPVGNYFKGGLSGIRLQAVKGFGRAAPGGSGCVKASGNYAPIFQLQRQVKQRGYDDVLCLDAVR